MVGQGSSTKRAVIPALSAYWIMLAVFLTATMVITIPTPLYSIWELRDHFSTAVGTVVFAMNAVGVLISLVLAANLSTRIGRRPAMIAGLALLLLACIFFTLDPDLPGILAARLVGGLGIGIVTATAPTYVSELRKITKPDADPERGGAIISYLTMGGIALGTLVTVIFAVFTTAFLRLPFATFAVLYLVSILVLLFVPETTTADMRRKPFTVQRVRLPANERPTFFATMAGGFCSFAVLGFFGALAPALVAEVTGLTGKAESELGGLVAFSIFVSAAVGQLGFVAASQRTKIAMTALSTSIGLVCIGFSVVVPNLPGVIIGGILAGLGAGLVFLVSLSTASVVATPEQRPEAISAIYFAAYIGMPLPVIGTGIGLITVGPLITVPVFGAAILVLVLWCCFHINHTLNKQNLASNA